MEDQKPAENNTPATPEVTSSTPEVTKRSLRVDTWRSLQENNYGITYNGIFNRIPNFVNAAKAGALLAETEEFKNAKKIKVNIDRALDHVKLAVLAADKELYLPGTRNSNALYLKVECPAGATQEKMNQIIHINDVNKSRTEITLDNKVVFDMVVIGSVRVSRDGYRIGRGNGFNDLDIGLLIEIGSITPDTIIATFLHDTQVVDNLPTNLFTKYDTPVDLIITPLEVIKVAKRLPRPTGIFWELVSERRLKIIPALAELKEREEKAGKVITLKEENTDVESSTKRRSVRKRGNVFKSRYQQRPTQEYDRYDRQRRRRSGPVGRRVRAAKPSKSDANANDESEVNQQPKKSEQPPRQPRKPRQSDSASRKERFCVKVTNIPNFLRVRDLKTELRKREVNPIYITWKGQFGKCYLHFAKSKTATEDDEDVNNVLKSLSELAITTGEQQEPCILTTELIKFNNNVDPPKNESAAPQEVQQRVETVGSTSV